MKKNNYQNMTIIYIVGPRASGKSSVGKILAKELGYSFYDQDHIFHQKHGTISNFIAKHGWKKYYGKMFKIITILSSNNTVISCGACIFMNDTNTGTDAKKIAFCKKRGIIVALAPSRFSWWGAKVTFSRSGKRDNTMLGTALPKESFSSYLKQYKIKFHGNKKYSDIVIYDNRSPARAAKKVLFALKKRGIISKGIEVR